MKSKTPNLTPEQIAQVLGDPPAKIGLENLSNNPVFFPGRLINLLDMSQMVTEKLLNAWVFFGREFQKSAERKDDALRVVGKEDRERLVQALVRDSFPEARAFQ
jgi:hypothetical protein